MKALSSTQQKETKNKSTSKSNRLKFSATVMASLLLVIPASHSVQNCIQLLAPNFCDWCYAGSPVPNGKGAILCTPFNSTSQNQNCFASDESVPSKCPWCKQGYYTSNSTTCEKLLQPITNCIKAEIDVEGVIKCKACQGGYPSSDFSKCLDTKDVQGAIPNCRDGTRFATIQDPVMRPQCFICEEGYALDNTKLTCRPTTMKGCWWMSKNGTCHACRAFDGYDAYKVVAEEVNFFANFCQKSENTTKSLLST